METHTQESTKAPSREEMLGRVLDGRYRITARLGSGGVGDVYRAEHLRLNRDFAVKVLQPAYVASERLRVRFEREAQALASLSHPNVVAITDYGVDQMPFLVMELLEGETLSQALRRGPMEPELAFNITRQILRALAFAHGEGLIHRDLKPGNVFLQRLVDGGYHVKILDFGLAKFVAADRHSEGLQVTVTGMVFGTPAYMSPEQATGVEADHRTDLYATAIVLFEMLAGQRPFDGEPKELLRMQLLAAPPRLQQMNPSLIVGHELETFFLRGMAKERQDRFADASAMLQALNDLPEGVVTRQEALPADAMADTIMAGEGLRAVAPGGAAAPTAQGEAEQQTAWAGGRGVQSASSGARPSGARSSRQPLRLPAWAGGGILGLVLLVGVGLGINWIVADEPAAQGQTRASPLTAQPSEPAPASAVVPPSPSPSGEQPDEPLPSSAVGAGSSAPYDPWAAGPLPAVVAQSRNILDRGGLLSSRLLRQLQAYAGRHRDDPRPQLLLGRHYVRRGYRADGIERYERAHEVDPRARFDPFMLPDLVQLVGHRAVGRRAARAVQNIYGEEALAAFDQALAAPSLDSATRQRLQKVRQSLVNRNP